MQLSATSTDLLTAATRYRDDCGWIVHPLHGPNQGTEKERGKKPKLRGWKKLDFFDCDDAFLQKHFGGHAPANVGVVIQSPHVVIDLDSKKDDGQSVLDWLASKPALAGWPRERTAGGVHLHIRCEDVPAEAVEAAGRNQKLTATLGEGLTAEVFLGGNVVVAPSVHKTGHRYTWEVTGEIPLVPWADLETLFFDQSPVKQAQPRGRPTKPKPFWAHYRGDLRTLDVTGLAKHLGIYGQPLGGEEGKHTVRCPWRDQHSDAHTPWNPGDSSTVVWQAKPGSFPNFFCAHVSHGEKTLADFLAWAESRERGVVDKFCAEMRVWEPGQTGEGGRPRVLLPNIDRPDSEFAAEIGGALTDKAHWFNKSGLVVEVRKVQGEGLLFVPLKAAGAVTSVEKFVEVGILVKSSRDEEAEYEFRPRSMSQAQASVLLEAGQLRDQLPPIERMFHVPLPILLPTGELATPNRGYDARFRSWLDLEAPELRRMDLEEAKGWLAELLREFCFRDEQAVVHAIAAILTPFCRGLFPRWTCRTPIFVYEANRPRSGKDYLAGNIALIHEGRDIEDAPIPRDSQELRKKITTTLVSGRRRMHFANCRGFLNSDVLENIATSEQWADRLLGYNQEVTLGNELEFSLSGNIGLTYTPDFSNRTRKVALAFFEEDANKRSFQRSDLKQWTRAHRAELLSALMALVRHWDGRGRPKGPTPFTSFPAWAEVVGGVMAACELGDPCLPDVGEESGEVNGDTETRDMRALFRAAYEQYPDEWIKRTAIYELISGDEDADWFHWIEFESKSGKTRFGLILSKFVGRELDGIRLHRDQNEPRAARRRFKFSRTDGGPVKKQGDFWHVFGSTSPKVSNVSNFEPENRKTVIGEVCDLDTLDTLDTFTQPADFGEINQSKILRGKEEEKKNIHVFKYVDMEDRANVSKDTNVSKPPVWQLVTDSADFDDIGEEIAMAGHAVALDIETYGRDALNPRRSDIRLLCLSVPWRKPWLIDLQATGYDLGDLGAILGNSELVIHNARFDLGFLAHHCGIRARNVFCTLTASRLLTAGTRQSNSLGEVLRRHGIADLPKDLGPSDWGGMIFDDQLAYAAADVVHLHALRERLAADLTGAGLDAVWALETELIPVVIGMEQAGFAMDRLRLEGIREEHRGAARHLADQVREALGANINPASPDQLRKALQAAGVKVRSTAEGVLANVKHPAAALVLEMRGAEKVAQQAQSLIDAIEEDGRIHGQFDPTGTEAGRFAARSPNLQNIGRGALRDCFVAPEGSVLVCADYSQIELRVAAAIANETRMIEAYRSGADLHRRTAALVLGKAEEAEVSKEDRQLAKACFSGDTEILTPKGWVRFDQYDGRTPVAQFILPDGVRWNPARPRSNRWGLPTNKVRWNGIGAIEFTEPLAYRQVPDQELWHHADRNTDLLLTGDHQVAFISSSGNPMKVPAATITPQNCRHMIVAGHMARNCREDELMTRFLAMFMADGSWSSGRSVRFGFTKRRKIERCTELCEALGLDHSRDVIPSGATSIRVHSKDLITWLGRWTTRDKRLEWRCLLDLDPEIYLDEAQHWDAHCQSASHHSSRNRVTFTTTVEQTADVMQAMAATCGLPSTLSREARINPNHRTIFRLSYRLGGQPLCRSSFDLKPTERVEPVYCVQVPSGAILLRRNGKVSVQGNCNFGLLYGQSAPGLVRYAKTSYGIEMTEGEAERIREKFFRAYTGLAAWHATTRREAKGGLAETRTRIGRRRLMPQGEGDFWARFSGGLNTPVQGGAADGLKRALVLLAERLPKEAAILSTVHDEVIVECPEVLGEAVARTMEDAMTEAMAAIYPEVPVEVEAHVGRTWNEAK